jgi:hypothetical protein
MQIVHQAVHARAGYVTSPAVLAVLLPLRGLLVLRHLAAA